MASSFLTANSEQHLHTWGESVDQQWCFSTCILVLAWSRSTLRLHDPFQHNIYFSSHILKPSVPSHPCYTHSLSSSVFVSHLSKWSIHITFAIFNKRKLVLNVCLCGCTALGKPQAVITEEELAQKTANLTGVDSIVVSTRHKLRKSRRSKDSINIYGKFLKKTLEHSCLLQKNEKLDGECNMFCHLEGSKSG